ncbi:hypothetical protein Tasa_009_067 [Tanticharoenia sakaeratensis NBRC 103193]|uniref:Uncharacterized protein n=1 Tax=Tanticharoenia sakaeratensis NBRC 103193 TaxID=1231623 RepID=A0A0D6MI36_9PROT|nr:hypothetical protein [Tanticharoenia sakaeratensis]GAN53272.1 hypothetical protein Tasa_009_067 [Tanticharoenia sakaeratensis NBRC 103193]GBQ21123.1 hypothetical protein AA103193_1620 [Tanticharoenia sakaeratensis NBRC 103193]
MRVVLAQLAKSVGSEINDQKWSVWLENARGFGNGSCGALDVTQNLMQHRETAYTRGDRKRIHVALLEGDLRQAGAVQLAPRDPQHCRAAIERCQFGSAIGRKLDHPSCPCSHIEHAPERSGKEDGSDCRFHLLLCDVQRPDDIPVCGMCFKIILGRCRPNRLDRRKPRRVAHQPCCRY